MLQLNSKNLKGLTGQEAAEALKKYGLNELPDPKKRTMLKMFLEVLREPMFFLLLASGILYLFLGDIYEAMMLLGAIFIVIGITLYQEQKTENALAALRDLSSPQALVIRDGKQKRIPGREVAVNDLVIISEGERVPADGVLLQTSNLNLDESLLTGESISVRKTSGGSQDQQIHHPGGDNTPFVFSGTLVVRGQGIFQAVSTGQKTEMGKIGRALEDIGSEQTDLQKQTAVVVKNFAFIGLAICVFVFIYYSYTHNDWLNGLLAGLTLAMSMMPEEFPVVMTVFLALGAWRISRKKVLTRRIPAVETLGAITTLCVDKTGTLTMNKMAVEKICIGTKIYETKDLNNLPEKFFDFVRCALLATPVDPFDPMEKAINELGIRTGIVDRQKYEFLKGYPLSDKLLAMSNVWRMDNGETVIAAKGSPEAIMDICHLSDSEKKQVEKQVERLAGQGLRVIGTAKARASEKLPEEQHDFDFEYVGLLGLVDPIRPEVPAAIAECRSAGVKVIMITGDYPGTAKMIAQKIGFGKSEKIMTGSEMENMSEEEFQKKIKNVSIFARIVPEQKLMIVKALKAGQEVVAMTGDGVNDAPALKAADIGIAMGKRGSDVAREASALILLDDNFASIVAAIKMGRRIYDNLKKAITFIFSVHIPIAGISLLSVLMGWPLVLLPVHIVFLEMIIDPACSIVFEMEKAEADLMKRKPRKLNSRLFSYKVMMTGLIQGLAVFAAVALVYSFSLSNGLSENQARVLAYMNLVLGNLGLILINRSRSESIFATLKKPNPALWWVVLSAIFFLAVSMSAQFTRKIFKFDPVSWQDLFYSFAVIAAAIIVSEILKLTLVQRLRK